MNELKAPIFCLTGDVDWASEYCIQDYLDLVQSYNIPCTLFATHKSKILEHSSSPKCEIGIHPNFLPRSTHGDSTETVIQHIFDLFPDAKTFRSHSFVDSSPITTEMVRRGVRYDSNLCLYMQPKIAPLRHWSGILRFPVFWEDDCHASLTGGDWEVEKWLPQFLSPGLKILNFHPFLVSTNTPNLSHYQALKGDTSTWNGSPFEGKGVRTFFKGLMDALIGQHKARFWTLQELYEMFKNSSAQPHSNAGRETVHSVEEHRKYGSMSAAEKQDFLKQSYDLRNPKDIYATSRDVHLRELEICALSRQLKDPGVILDLGCGNGWTLLSLAKKFANYKMIGVDYSSNLIQGAKELVKETQEPLLSSVEFVHGNAIDHLCTVKDASVKYVITERFLLNLPDQTTQKQVIEQVVRVLEPGGLFLMCEGSQQGFETLNTLRKELDLAIIPETSGDNISALRFTDKELEQFIEKDTDFNLEKKLGFSWYFAISRILHPVLASPMPPHFDSPINQIARKMQESMPFDAGIGTNTLWVLKKRASHERS